ncbi:hypothetical protein Q5424_19650 [Conexibacter sp. JD483]|uniref:hypothetical protein n=1 Tax=unclassified Conexibacter TaxID=2627773 RepID=UPI002728F539|nr:MULTISPECIES: hypothetical protein [unclassified Conexibacter]MDO8188794.1 hypothetical protein [Conexibacter sp. CPCC 205706]MDO8201639.1 hypothetical protein [Conexibacter sp. CPCC 205762]MDR9371323.1 hypothetical protein [Conexibacter sp. JD483]
MRRLLLVAVLGLSACGGGDAPTTRPDHPADLPPTPREQREAREVAKRPPAPSCGADTAGGNCSTAQGRVIALESVDPDGDGDLHLILLGGSITAPGISVLDVNKDLRPKVDPKIGDWAAGAGPVYSGSHGQHQIQVTAVEVWPHR